MSIRQHDFTKFAVPDSWTDTEWSLDFRVEVPA